MTAGQLMFIFGIVGTVFFSFLLILFFVTAGRKRRRLLDKINREL